MEPDFLTAFTLGVVAGAVAGAIAISGIEAVRGWLRRPRLALEGDRPESGDHFTCNALVVANRGRSVAKNCMGSITFEDLDAGQLVSANTGLIQVEDIGMEPVKFNVRGTATLLMSQENNRLPIENELLAWARLGNPVAIDIPPGVTAMLDVLRYMRPEGRQGQIHIPSERGWSSVLAALKPGTYAVRVTVFADNAKAVGGTFNIQAHKHRSSLAGPL